MRTRSKAGATFIELLLLVALVSIIAIPTLRYLMQIENAKADIASAQRRNSVQSLQEQIIASGIDPLTTNAFAAAKDGESKSSLATTLGYGGISSLEKDTLDLGSAAQISIMSLRDATGDTPAVIGLEIGRGPEPPPLEQPTAPLDPIAMEVPTLLPATGTNISVLTLSAGAPGDPYTATVTASSTAPLSVVHIVVDSPFTQAEGAGSASVQIDAVALEGGVTGRYWNEYDGSSIDGALAQPLGDGRTRWWVPTEDGWQAYNPSAFASYGYGISTPAPMLNLSGSLASSGDTLYITWEQREDYAAASQVVFPPEMIAAFGDQWGSVAPTFSVYFDGYRNVYGPSSGDLTPIFENTATALARWWNAPDENVLTVGATGGPGMNIPESTFVFIKSPTDLEPPSLATAAYDDGSSTWSAGAVTYRADNVGDSPVGNVEIDSTRTASTEASTEL